MIGQRAKRAPRSGPKEVSELRARLREAEDMLRAFNNGEIDAVVRSGAAGKKQVYTRQGADHVYRVMVETMLEGAITISTAGIILYANRRFAELLTTDLDNIMGRPLQDFVAPAAQGPLSDLLHSSHDEPQRCAMELKRSSGVAVPVHLAMRRLEVGGIECLIAIVTDLSELKQSETELRRADERFRLALEAAPTGMLLTDPSGSIVLVNAEVEKIFGYGRAELLGRPIEILLSLPPAAAGGKAQGLRKDGSVVPVEMAFTPLLHSSQGELTLASVVDLSSRQEVDRLRSEFVSMVSHELRTPLTAIRGSLGLLAAGAMGPLPEKPAAMLRIAYKNAGRLERIINDILDIGTLEAGKLTFELASVPLAELLRQSIEASAGHAELCKVRFVLDERCGEERVTVDPHRLVQAMVNLLSNAAKFSPAGADVLIRVRAGADRVRIEVEDSGAGIPVAFQNSVFEKFAQADSSANRRFAGTGLGLSITRKLIEAMGGTIGFRTVVDQGTTFFLELPRGEAPAA